MGNKFCMAHLDDYWKNLPTDFDMQRKKYSQMNAK